MNETSETINQKQKAYFNFLRNAGIINNIGFEEWIKNQLE